MEEFLEKYLSKDESALLWVRLFVTYSHGIDDIIDNDIPANKNRQEFIIRTFETALILYSHPFYIKNIHILYSLLKMVTNAYMDSVQFEGDTAAWKKHYSDYLSSCGNEVILACIELISGYDARREASPILRELSYNTHHDNAGNKI